jgi:hypothetical protein
MADARWSITALEFVAFANGDAACAKTDARQKIHNTEKIALASQESLLLQPGMTGSVPLYQCRIPSGCASAALGSICFADEISISAPVTSPINRFTMPRPYSADAFFGSARTASS